MFPGILDAVIGHGCNSEKNVGLVDMCHDRIVHLGCGDGRVTRLMAERWPRARVTGIDRSPEMLDAAVTSAGLTTLFDAVLSVEDAGVYKPDPRTYQLAVDRLGASGAAAFAALVPVLVTLLGIPVLGEIPDLATVLSGAFVCVGVFLASGVISRAR